MFQSVKQATEAQIAGCLLVKPAGENQTLSFIYLYIKDLYIWI